MLIDQPVKRVAGTAAAIVFALGSIGEAMAADDSNAQHAHVHGIATLGIAVERNIVTIQFESPLDSLIGFEHRPNTAAERESVTALQARLKTPTNLFRLTPAAECKLDKAEAESGLFQEPAAGASNEHADLDASFSFRCEHIDRLVAIDTGLFDAYPRLQKMTIVVATAKGQFKHDLKRPDRTVVLTR